MREGETHTRKITMGMMSDRIKGEALNKAEWIHWSSRSIIRQLSQSLNNQRNNWRANIFSFHFKCIWHLSKTVASCSIRRFLEHLIRRWREKKVNWCVNKPPFVFWCSNRAHYLQIFDELLEPLRGSNTRPYVLWASQKTENNSSFPRSKNF